MRAHGESQSVPGGRRPCSSGALREEIIRPTGVRLTLTRRPLRFDQRQRGVPFRPAHADIEIVGGLVSPQMIARLKGAQLAAFKPENQEAGILHSDLLRTEIAYHRHHLDYALLHQIEDQVETMAAEPGEDAMPCRLGVEEIGGGVPVEQEAVEELGLNRHYVAERAVRQRPFETERHRVIAPLEHCAGGNALLSGQRPRPGANQRHGWPPACRKGPATRR